MINKKFLLILTLFLAMTIGGCGIIEDTIKTNPVKQVFSYVDGINKSPQAVFLKSWRVIKDNYIDKTCNHQDWSRWKTRYLNEIQTKEDAYVAIESMIESLNDPYTRFLTPYDFKEQNMSIDSKLYGIGVHIGQMKDKVIIIDVIENSPAQRIGLKAGDIILKVNGNMIKGVDLKQIAAKIRGEAGTKVKLTILRKKNLIVKDVPREKINIKSVQYKNLGNNIAYIKISSFISQETALEMASALKKAKNARGIILDVRGNHGGLLPNAIFISNMFIQEGIIVNIVDKDGVKEKVSAEPFDILVEQPLVVLINESSASASEILSGALKDNKRAILVGEKTYGKGLVQRIESLPDGSGINITIAKYLTPNGTDINKKGINPDYKVKMTEKDYLTHKDPQLDKAKQLLSTQIVVK